MSMPRPWLYLFVGPDRPRKFQRLQELERALDIHALDRHQLDASALSAVELVAFCRQHPAASRVRLIVVDQAHRVSRECAEILQEQSRLIAATACVVLLLETAVSLRHPLARLESDAVTERFEGRGLPAAKPFALTDALGIGDVGGALGAVRDQLFAGKEPLELLGLVAWQLNRWVIAKRLLGGGGGPERIASVMGLKPWQVQRLQSEVARRPLASLQHLLHRCWQLDVDAKRGRAVPGLAIEQLVVEVCGGEAPVVSG